MAKSETRARETRVGLEWDWSETRVGLEWGLSGARVRLKQD